MNSQDRNLHYIVIDKGDYPFKYWHQASILSAIKHLNPTKISLWINEGTEFENQFLGFFDTLENGFPGIYKVEVAYIKDHVEVNNRVIDKPSHVVDWYKTHILHTHGGVYSDLDNIFMRDMTEYFDSEVHRAPLNINLETKTPEALAANLIFSPKFHPFTKFWKDSYDFYIPQLYSFNATVLPFDLYYFREDLGLNIEGVDGNWMNESEGLELYKLLEGDHLEDWSSKDVIHLWDSRIYQKLNKYTADYIESVDNTFTKLIRPYLSYLNFKI